MVMVYLMLALIFIYYNYITKYRQIIYIKNFKQAPSVVLKYQAPRHIVKGKIVSLVFGFFFFSCKVL